MLPIMKSYGGNSAPEFLTLGSFGDEVNLLEELDQGYPASPYKPQIAIRVRSDGRLQLAQGNTSAALVYSNVGNDFLAGGNDAALYEVKLTINSGGSGGSTTGSSTFGSFLALTVNKSWIFFKDNTNLGSVEWNLSLEIREIADTSNTVSVSSFTATLVIAL